MTEGLIVKTQQNPLFFSLYLLGSGGCQPLLAVSLNQRVQGSSPCAPTIETSENVYKIEIDLLRVGSSDFRADP